MSRYALSTSAAAALLAGCGVAQPPIGAPGATPQSRAMSALADRALLRRYQSNATALASGSYKVLYSFKGLYEGMDGAFPAADLTNVNGTLYGTTSDGGYTSCGSASECGTVFAISRFGKERILHRFSGSPDGADPIASLVALNGVLYGTTCEGGSGNNGTVFTMTASGVEHVVYTFKGQPDGACPEGIINQKGTLYGLTSSGGTGAEGTVFRMIVAGKERVLYSFNTHAYDGRTPEGRLVGVKDMFYGVTFRGGTHYNCGSGQTCGTVFSVTPDGTERVIYSFKGISKGDAEFPQAGLTALNGVLYGTAPIGGAKGGSVFSVTRSGDERIVFGFKGPPYTYGATPLASLTADGGALYGTTQNGGAGGSTCGGGGCGTVFKVTPSGSEQVLHSFSGPPDGRFPMAGLTIVNDGLYGTTAEGGTACDNTGCGTVFRISP
ncbi:MAG: choice-of-anchor tandem repeat GloVer-containing protein [Candidatus Cybelea sp.]